VAVCVGSAVGVIYGVKLVGAGWAALASSTALAGPVGVLFGGAVLAAGGAYAFKVGCI